MTVHLPSTTHPTLLTRCTLVHEQADRVLTDGGDLAPNERLCGNCSRSAAKDAKEAGGARQDRDPAGDRHAECSVLYRDDRGRPVAICAAEAGRSHADHDDRDLVRPLTDEEATWEGPSS